MNSAFFSDLLASIAERGRSLLGRKDWSHDPAQAALGLVEACEALLSGRGEASGAAIATEVLDRYASCDSEGRRAFFVALAERFGPDHARLSRAVEAYRQAPSVTTEAELHFAAEPRRQELFRRLNRTPGGTGALVSMRADLLQIVRNDPLLAAVDADFSHLLASWFNRGFLVLRRIDWSTPASILEKIIRY
jgi:malonyl-CoA decarboxylase